MSFSFSKSRLKAQTHSGSRRLGQVTPNVSALQGSPLNKHLEISLQNLTCPIKAKNNPPGERTPP